jgi:hypothetical protein
MRDSDTLGLRQVRLDDNGKGDKCNSGRGETPVRSAVCWIGADDGCCGWCGTGSSPGGTLGYDHAAVAGRVLSLLPLHEALESLRG